MTPSIAGVVYWRPGWRYGETFRLSLVLALLALLGLLGPLGASRASAQPTTLPIADEPSLIDAIRTVTAAFVQGPDDGPYIIDLQSDITLTRSLPSIRTRSPGDGNAWVTIQGNSHRIDANNTGRVFVIAAGIVAIDHVGIVNARARGGNGGDAHHGGSGGGGLGAGAAIFVNAGAVLHTTSVTIENAEAIGGSGGAIVRGIHAANKFGGGGGGGLNGDGGLTSDADMTTTLGPGGGGGGGYLGAGGANRTNTTNGGGAGGGGEEGAGAVSTSLGGNGGGGATGRGGRALSTGGGGGGGKAAPGGDNPGSGFSFYFGFEGGVGGGDNFPGSAGHPAGGGGGGGINAGGGAGGLLGGGGGGGHNFGPGGAGGAGGGGGGGGKNGDGGRGGEFGGGGGGGLAGMGGAGGLGAGGGGAGQGIVAGGSGGFGGGGGGYGDTPGGEGFGGPFGGTGGRTGGGGGALGGGIYVHEGGTLTFSGDFAFAGTFAVTPGVGGAADDPDDNGGNGEAHSRIFYLTGGPSAIPVTFDSTGGTRLIPGDNAIAGEGSFGTAAAGGGVLLIDGNNSEFTGTVRLASNPGVLRVGHDAALGGATLRGHGGRLGTSAAGPIALSNNIVLDTGLTIDTLQPLTLYGTISGPGSLEIDSPGQSLTLSGVNDATGGLFVNGGTVNVSSDNHLGAAAAGVTINSGGILDATGTVDTNRPIILNGGTITGSGELRVRGSLLAASTFTKNGTGILSLEGLTAFGSTALLLLNDGMVQGAGDALPPAIVTAPTTHVRFLQGTAGVYAGSISGDGSVSKTGPGALMLTGQLSYTGMTTVVTGTVLLKGTSPLGDISNAGTVTFDPNGYMTYSGRIGGTGTLRKTGSGSLRLTNTLNHQGATIVDAGALQMDGTVTLTAFNVTPGSTLAGSGTLRLATIQSGATLSPGAIGSGGVSAPGALTAQVVTMQAGATLAIDINGPNAGTHYDRLDASVHTDLNGATLHVTIGGSPASYTPVPGTAFVIVTNATGAFAGLPEGATVQAGARRFRITYAGGDGNDVALVASEAPTITGLIDRSTSEDATLGPIAFTVADDLTSASTLIISATSSNQLVVADSGITPGGSGASRTLTIAPVANAFGTTTITVRVEDDEGLATQQSFLLTVTAMNDAPTITLIPNQVMPQDAPALVLPFVVSDVESPAGALTLSASSTNAALVPSGSVIFGSPSGSGGSGGAGASRTLAIAPAAGQSGTAIITIEVSDGADTSSTSFTLLVIAKPATPGTPGTPGTPETTVYYLAEGATGTFFDTDLLLANPQTVEAPVTIEFLRGDGITVMMQRTLAPLSRVTVRLDDVPGLESTTVSTRVTSLSGGSIVVERTMRWDASAYGAHTEKATAGAAAEWYFAEGAQGFFSTYLLLVNPHATANVAHVTWLREGEPALMRDYPLAPSSRITIDASTEPDLVNRSFGARVVFDQPGAAERAMYFGASPLWSGGHASAGATAPATRWLLAEGATGSYFTTFVLVANPNDDPADLTFTYLPLIGPPVTTTKTLAARQRLTVNIAEEDPSLASAAVSTDVQSTVPVVVECAQYWPQPAWHEAHNSFGVTSAATTWGLAEGRIGGPRAEQTYILLANPSTEHAADVTLTFLRENGAAPVVKTFTVQPSSRFNVAIAGATSDVPELIDESFGARIDATQPIVVERSVYGNANGVTWAAGTNATATRLP